MVLDGRAGSADQDEFAVVFATHQRAVYRLAFVLCGDTSLAEEATAEAFARCTDAGLDGARTTRPPTFGERS